jgi:hypothetical protein
MENKAPSGFQHFVQPHTWLWALWLDIVISTLFLLQWQVSFPPEKSSTLGVIP